MFNSLERRNEDASELLLLSCLPKCDGFETFCLRKCCDFHEYIDGDLFTCQGSQKPSRDTASGIQNY